MAARSSQHGNGNVFRQFAIQVEGFSDPGRMGRAQRRANEKDELISIPLEQTLKKRLGNGSNVPGRQADNGFTKALFRERVPTVDTVLGVGIESAQLVFASVFPEAHSARKISSDDFRAVDVLRGSASLSWLDELS